MVDIVQRVRKFKSEKQISLKEDLSKIIIKCSEKDRKLLELIIQDIKAVTKVKDIEFDKGEFDIIIEQ